MPIPASNTDGSIQQNPFEDEAIRLASAISIVKTHIGDGEYEWAVVRYSRMVLDNCFQNNPWDCIDQYRTPNGKFPDLALENFVRLRPTAGNPKPRPFFVPRVFVEYKSLLSTADSIQQLIDSVVSVRGSKFRSRGFLIGVEGLTWVIKEYHVHRSGIQAYKCLT